MASEIIVYCTVPNKEIALSISKTVVEEKLAACSNIIPGLVSVYSWQNEICQDDELLLVIKTANEIFQKLHDRIIDLHPYDVPEIIGMPIEMGSKPYLDWIHENVSE